MTTLRKYELIRHSDSEDIYRVELDIDTADELPTDGKVEGLKICQGSIAWDISTGDFYALNGSNEWIKQGGE